MLPGKEGTPASGLFVYLNVFLPLHWFLPPPPLHHQHLYISDHQEPIGSSIRACVCAYRRADRQDFEPERSVNPLQIILQIVKTLDPPS